MFWEQYFPTTMAVKIKFSNFIVSAMCCTLMEEMTIKHTSIVKEENKEDSNFSLGNYIFQTQDLFS
jgi:predicted transcriptional regulator